MALLCNCSIAITLNKLSRNPSYLQHSDHSLWSHESRNRLCISRFHFGQFKRQFYPSPSCTMCSLHPNRNALWADINRWLLPHNLPLGCDKLLKRATFRRGNLMTSMLDSSTLRLLLLYFLLLSKEGGATNNLLSTEVDWLVCREVSRFVPYSHGQLFHKSLLQHC